MPAGWVPKFLTDIRDDRSLNFFTPTPLLLQKNYLLLRILPGSWILDPEKFISFLDPVLAIMLNSNSCLTPVEKQRKQKNILIFMK